jgi:hypothetical protein
MQFEASPMSSESWKRIIVTTLVALGCEAGCICPLSFAPGWANGWPFGLTIHAVWSGTMALLLFLVLMTVAASLGAVIGYTGNRFATGRRLGGSVYVIWLVVAAALALGVGVWAYQEIHAATLRMWPNGYPNRRA